ncbi:fructose-1,6-bisphosphatase, class II [Anoxybacter fermentans]|uniref:Fructose-1,6-bisphosphatase n=1 Tax=Anoxybacter fermentans TaxID=1323375 RepID=A0A3S9T2S7_9FIRM|nr:fructose-1,6-bisphosphatase, class II [Anoxybacter fermentans]
MQRELAIEFVRVTEAAALASAPWMGKGDKMAADGAAVAAMRAVFDTVNIDGVVVIGEGEMDEAPQLYIGEHIGSKGAPVQVDIAVDPLEGTNLVAKGLPNAIAVIAVAPRGTLLNAPDMYMEKIAVGPKAKGCVHLDSPIEVNLNAVARAKGKSVSELTVVILDRERHSEIIKKVRQAGARIKLISDGDVSAGISVAFEETGVDVLLGIGGAPEGVLTAAALKCLGGEFQGRLVFENDEQIKRAKAMGITDLNKIYTIDELVCTDDVMFAATGITDGDFLRGVRYTGEWAITHSIVMRSKTGTIRYIDAYHKITQKPEYYPKDVMKMDK